MLGGILCILDRPPSEATAVLQRRFFEIAREIEALREHHRAIARLVGATKRFRRHRMVTKQKWVEIMRAAGFGKEQMHRCIVNLKRPRQPKTRSSWSSCTCRPEK